MATEHDPKLVEDLAEVIGGDHWWECDHFNESSEDGCKVDAVRAALDWLAERGRLLPSGGEAETRWAVCWVGYEDGTVEYSDEVYARYVYEMYAPGGVYHVAGKDVEMLRRDARTFDDGSYYVGPWVPVVSDNSEKGAGDA